MCVHSFLKHFCFTFFFLFRGVFLLHRRLLPQKKTMMSATINSVSNLVEIEKSSKLREMMTKNNKIYNDLIKEKNLTLENVQKSFHLLDQRNLCKLFIRLGNQNKFDIFRIFFNGTIGGDHDSQFYFHTIYTLLMSSRKFINPDFIISYVETVRKILIDKIPNHEKKDPFNFYDFADTMQSFFFSTAFVQKIRFFPVLCHFIDNFPQLITPSLLDFLATIGSYGNNKKLSEKIVEAVVKNCRSNVSEIDRIIIAGQDINLNLLMCSATRGNLVLAKFIVGRCAKIQNTNYNDIRHLMKSKLPRSLGNSGNMIGLVAYFILFENIRIFKYVLETCGDIVYFSLFESFEVKPVDFDKNKTGHGYLSVNCFEYARDMLSQKKYECFLHIISTFERKHNFNQYSLQFMYMNPFIDEKRLRHDYNLIRVRQGTLFF